MITANCNTYTETSAARPSGGAPARAAAAAYVRVSSKAQTLEMQRAAMARAAAARGDTIASWYAEKRARGSSRAPSWRVSARPPERERRRRLFVFRPDRLSRSGIRDTFEELRAAGVELVTVADGFDLAGPAAEVVLAVMAWAARWSDSRSTSASRPPASGLRPRAAPGADRDGSTAGRGARARSPP